MPTVILLAPLFVLFELWQLVLGERYLGVKQIARGVDPRALGLGEATAFCWSAMLGYPATGRRAPLQDTHHPEEGPEERDDHRRLVEVDHPPERARVERDPPDQDPRGDRTHHQDDRTTDLLHEQVIPRRLGGRHQTTEHPLHRSEQEPAEGHGSRHEEEKRRPLPPGDPQRPHPLESRREMVADPDHGGFAPLLDRLELCQEREDHARNLDRSAPARNPSPWVPFSIPTMSSLP